jgi:SanA protein
MSKKMDYIKLMKKFVKLIALTILVGILVIVSINLIMVSKVSDYIYTNIDDIPKGQAVIVLGAYVRGDNLSLVLEDRVEAALELVVNDKADKILLSGDHGQVEYDEVNSMRRYVLNDGSIDEEDIFLDHAGFDTYDSMYRAKEVFGIESAIIVTQEFHIDRAVYIARELGIDAVGYSVNQDKYKISLQANWYGREFLSRVKAFLDVMFQSEPRYLGDKIPITGDGRLSWDEFD